MASSPASLVREHFEILTEPRVVGQLTNTVFVMNQLFWIGVYPGLTSPMLEYVLETIHRFCAGSSAASLPRHGADR